jgi:hypothetical protein
MWIKKTKKINVNESAELRNLALFRQKKNNIKTDKDVVFVRKIGICDTHNSGSIGME